MTNFDALIKYWRMWLDESERHRDICPIAIISFSKEFPDEFTVTIPENLPESTKKALIEWMDLHKEQIN